LLFLEGIREKPATQVLLEQLDLLGLKVQRVTKVTQDSQAQQAPLVHKVQQDPRAIQVIPDRLALLDRQVQQVLLGLRVTLARLGLKVLPVLLDRLGKLVRLVLLVLLGLKAHKGTKAIRVTPEIQAHQVQQGLQDQLDQKALLDRQD
jgi:hypothetical protein